MKDLLLVPSVRLYNGASWLKEKVTDFAKSQDGVTAIEYAVIAVAVSGVLLTAFSGNDGLVAVIKTQFSKMTSNINSIATTASGGK